MASLADLVNLDLSDCTDKIIVEYLWVGGSGIDIRSKARTVNGPITDASQLPKWNYDGSSTGQAPGEDSEVILYPQAIFKDPFRRGDNLLVMCDCYTPQGVPIPTNKRHNAAKIFNTPKVAAEETWYGIEQEYTLLQKDVNWPLGWPIGGYPGPQGPYYCAAGADKAFGRDIVDAHYKACLYAGINISGINGEVMPGQWEFQVGPSVGIAASDQLWVARYILEVPALPSPESQPNEYGSMLILLDWLMVNCRGSLRLPGWCCPWTRSRSRATGTARARTPTTAPSRCGRPAGTR
ncbi:hypothetical protein VPH35_073981 [Triticum aestivum]